MCTGVPSGSPMSSTRAVIASFGSRMQPWETARPMDVGSFVPWIPMTASPPANESSTGE